MQLPFLPPKVLAILDALHIRVPLRTIVFGTIDFYRQMRVPFIRHKIAAVENRIKKDIRVTKRKIKVCFVCFERSQWGYQSICDAMSQSGNFDISVLIRKNWIRNGDDSACQQLIQFFGDRKLRVQLELNKKDYPDVIVVPMYRGTYEADIINLNQWHKHSLCCLILYSWLLTDSDKHYLGVVDLQYLWRHILTNKRESILKRRLLPALDSSSPALGYPRNDELFHAKPNYGYWKSKSSKKIIWAPHWSVLTNEGLGNFDILARPMLNWLKKNPDVEIVLKPHPFLRARLTDKATIQTIARTDSSFVNIHNMTAQEYDAIISEWRNIPNGNVMDTGDYFGLFRSSDGIILDSISFMAEYLIMDKPMCFCNRKESLSELQSVFNDFGKELLEGMVIANCWEDVETFISTIAADVDNLKGRRHELQDKYLSLNQGRVGEAITEEIEKALKS